MQNVSYETNARRAKRPAVVSDPTGTTYSGLNLAYDFFNGRLFDSKLPACLITLQRHKGAYGYFAPGRFGSRDGSTTADEIALNPSHFKERCNGDILSTLVHEQAHLWQQHFGKPSRGGYHNKEWGAKMKELGLYPSSTAMPGGRETGQKVSHYIIKGGPFDLACNALLEKGFDHLYVELWDESAKEKKKRAEKAKSKTAFCCPTCETKAWAKPTASLMCGDCDEHMEAE
jgi:hypothetical protein